MTHLVGIYVFILLNSHSQSLSAVKYCFCNLSQIVRKFTEALYFQEVPRKLPPVVKFRVQFHHPASVYTTIKESTWPLRESGPLPPRQVDYN